MLCEQLIAEFTTNYMEKLFYFCLKKTGNETEAEDLTQDIVLNIVASLNKGTIPVSFSAWVWQIARNRYAVWADAKHRRGESVTDSDIRDYELEDESEPILDKIVRREQLALLRRELAFIKREYRNIVVAYYIEDKSIRDIASALSLSVAAVQQRLHRARIILLAAYRTPATAEELAIEVGVALPYMEDELKDLVHATLMKKHGNQYETNFFIVSAEAQEKITAHLQEIVSELTKAIIDSLEYEVSWKNENCPQWHEGYQPYEDMKWALLMKQTDVVNFYTLDAFNADRKVKPKANLGKWGHSIRPNNGEWDVLGMEIFNGERPAFVGLHGCVASEEERNLPNIDFQQFKYQYHNIDTKTPRNMPYTYAQALVALAKGEGSTVNEAVLNYLKEYGYIEKTETAYQPTFLVMFRSKGKQMPSDAREELESLCHKARDIAMRHYLFCRKQICKEIPSFLKDDEHQIDHACANIFSMRGAVLEEALRQGYLTYDEQDDKRMLGTFLTI